MRKYILTLAIALTTGIILMPEQSHAFPWAIVKEALKKVIKAIDLRIQKLQNKTIALQNAQKKIENILSKTKLKEISNWAEKQKKLYQKYYRELWKVKNLIATYQRVKDILKKQEELVLEFKNAWRLFQQDSHFTPQERNYMYGVYTGIVSESINNTNELMLAVNAFATQMSDGGRLKIIDQVAKNVNINLKTIRDFNRQNIQVSLQRAKNKEEMEAIKKMYGIQ